MNSLADEELPDIELRFLNRGVLKMFLYAVWIEDFRALGGRYSDTHSSLTRPLCGFQYCQRSPKIYDSDSRFSKIPSATTRVVLF